ncbi:MAG: type II secretion system protein GspG [Planctomycetes bacterium]|nr:type II secretion system protein GspG [Planctomycetota bacterium]MCC7169182.1 type II secretion system protein GspG [Planctomycetota bacterium]
MRARGFNVIEFVVILAVIVAMAGVVVPIMSVSRTSTPEGRAAQDCHRVAAAIQQFANDTHQFPTGVKGATDLHWLHTAGTLPANNVFASGTGAHLYDFLVHNEARAASWKGPYLERDVGPDPWGRSYLVNVNGYFNSGERVVVLSAGPNGQVNTSPSATIAGGDDILVILE